MLHPDRTWHREAPATAASLAVLRGIGIPPLPDEYTAFLAWSNGGEGPLAVEPQYLQLDAAETAAAAWSAGEYGEFFAGFFVFGSNGGGEYLAFDLRAEPPWPVVALDMTNIDLAESVRPVAADFAAFVALIGRESPVA